MISTAWEVGGVMGRLSRVVHPWSSRERLFAMLELTAFSDESYTEHEVYCVAGYWASARAWSHFDDQWKQELARCGLSEFHAEDCEQGHGEYANRKDRAKLRARFTKIVNANMLHGVFACIDLRGWDDIADEVAYLRPDARDPFYIPFQMFLEGATKEVDCFAPNERLAVVFDDREGAGKVVELYNSLRRDADPAFKVLNARLGSAVSGASSEYAGLQAADLLAYEARLYVSGPIWGVRGSERRPAWEPLSSKLRHGSVITREQMPALARQMRVKGGEGAMRRAAVLAARKADRDAHGAVYRARTSPAAPQSPEPGRPEETA